MNFILIQGITFNFGCIFHSDSQDSTGLFNVFRSNRKRKVYLAGIDGKILGMAIGNSKGDRLTLINPLAASLFAKRHILGHTCSNSSPKVLNFLCSVKTKLPFHVHGIFANLTFYRRGNHIYPSIAMIPTCKKSSNFRSHLFNAIANIQSMLRTNLLKLRNAYIFLDRYGQRGT